MTARTFVGPAVGCSDNAEIRPGGAMYPPGRRMRAPGGAGLRALPDPAEPEPGACREPGSRPRGIGGRPADHSSSFGRRFHGQGPWSAAGASGIRCEDATVGVVIPRFRCAKSPASMPDALTGGQRACSTYGDRVRPEPTPVIRIVSITGPPARPAQRILLCRPPASSARGRCSAMCPAAARFVAPGIRAAMRTFRPAGPRTRGPADPRTRGPADPRES